ncbi:siderophore ABC transporter substrate-binding protein [Propionicicella superfundia]|uniref:siderophore ABC transporter substrate-binding protein n=1 Tax=Propionicicella superfundia TaxID=348582 RepID=UPI000491FEBA|nr:ABC transporter substrate-binding protein [Propionicicella superfundia]
MHTLRRRFVALTAVSTAFAFVLAGCSASPTAEETTAAPANIEVQDNHGVQTIAIPPKSVVATDNRVFQTLADWGVTLKAAPVDLIPAGNPYKTDSSIVNLGSHNEPDLEAVVAVEPDLIINGQRFASRYEELKTLAPDAAIIELDPRDGEPFDEELKRQVEVLGKVFGHEEDAQRLIDDFDASIERVKKAYDSSDTVMAVITSGGEINYAAPGTGRTLGPVFEILDLTPALTADGSSDHQGDDISVEAIAASNPDWILVMDRDAAVSANSTDGSYTPANELLAGSAALKNVTAVQQGNIVYMPQFTYVNEGIQTYTAFFTSLAEQLEKS